MQDCYTSVFFSIVKETQDKHGYDLPFDIEVYVTMLLASYVDKPNFLPKNTFAESYLKLQYPYGSKAKTLGDICLFTTGVFPEYGSAKGLSNDYFVNIGQSSYDLARDLLNDELFLDLRNHFVFLKDFITVCIRDQDRIDISRYFGNH